MRRLLTCALSLTLAALTLSVPASAAVVRRPALATHPVAPVAALAADDTLSGWTPNGTTTLTLESALVRSGTLALGLGLPPGLPGSMGASSPGTAVTPGNRYSGSAWVRTSLVPRNAAAVLIFRNAAGGVTDSAWGQAQQVGSTGFTRLPAVVSLAPRNAATVQLAVVVFNATPGESAYVDDPSLVATPAGVNPVAGPLRVSGRTLVDRLGHRVMLRGVQRFGLEGGTSTPAPSDAEIAALAAWGANEVRVSLGDQLWLAGSCAYDSNYAARVDQLVHAITSRGMVALVNLHYTTTSACGEAGLQPLPEATRGPQFWREVAARYASNPLVAFDLFNEPYGVTEQQWLHGGQVSSHGTTYNAAGMQGLYDAVRGTGAKNVVVVSGLSFASAPPGVARVSGSNIVYGMHAYTCPHAAPPNCADLAPYDPSPLLNRWAAIAASSPVMVTEFGWPDRADSRYMTNLIAGAEARGFGWDAFAFDGSTAGLFDLLAGTASDGSTYLPSPAGMPVLAGMASNAPAASTGGGAGSATPSGSGGSLAQPLSHQQPASTHQARQPLSTHRG